MLSYSYRAFLVMDQLRRKAGISVAQLNSVLGANHTTYSRISKRVYDGREGVLHHQFEARVLNTLGVLAAAYDLKKISTTTLKRSNDVVGILQGVDRSFKLPTSGGIIDASVSDLRRIANKLLIT